MAEQPARKPRRVLVLTVLRTEWPSPHMVRVVAGGDGLSEFRDNEFTDHYVKLSFPPPGVRYPEPVDLEQVRAELPREQWPVVRTYTVRRFDAAAGELAIDFVVHGDEGVAGPWAAAAKAGDSLILSGPGGAYAPSPEADWHLLVGDEAGLPAVSNALEALPEDAVAKVLLEVAGPEEEQKLTAPPGAEVVWLHRGPGDAPGDPLVRAVTALEFPEGRVHAFVHGEAGSVMKRLRPHLLKERGVERSMLSISGYWRIGNTEEGFRKWKSDERAIEEAETTAGPS